MLGNGGCQSAAGKWYKRYVLTGQTLLGCRNKCGSYKTLCRGIHWIAADGHCHLLVDSATNLSGAGSNIHGSGANAASGLVTGIKTAAGYECYAHKSGAGTSPIAVIGVREAAVTCCCACPCSSERGA